jgi:ABC-type glycerol-3-phosphate transport system permease component
MTDTIKPQKSGGLSSRKRFYNILSYAALILLGFFFLFPLVFMFMSAFKSDESQLIRDLSSVKAFLPMSVVLIIEKSFSTRVLSCQLLLFLV